MQRGRAMNDERCHSGRGARKYSVARRFGREQSCFPIREILICGWPAGAFFYNAPVAAFAGAFLGCLTTLGLRAFGIVPCLASAFAAALLCGLFLLPRAAGLFDGAFFSALYGGTFGGMTQVVWLSSSAPGCSAMPASLLSLSLSIGCGLAFFAAAKLDIRSSAPFGAGYGGRLGAIASIASFLFVELARPLRADIGGFHVIPVNVSSLVSWTAPAGFFACLAGILGTMVALRQRRTAAAGGAARTFISSVVALLGLLILHLGNPRDTPTLESFYAGCFLGMSTPERLKGWFQPLSGALLLTALLVIIRACLPGVGGGLGLAAFISVALLTALSR